MPSAIKLKLAILIHTIINELAALRMDTISPGSSPSLDILTQFLSLYTWKVGADVIIVTSV